MGCFSYTPYTLPTIDFVGGETQYLRFHIYHKNPSIPFSVSGCTASFAIVDFLNRTGKPILTKEMKAELSELDEVHIADNILTVTLLPEETVDLSGKYIYQITIGDIDGEVEIPKQGILFITNNINKDFIRRF